MPHDQSIPSPTDAPSIETIDELIRKTAREGARQVLQQALVAEIQQHLEYHSGVRSADGRQAVVRNGYGPERTIMTGVGPVTIRRPRVDERAAVARNPHHDRFISGVLPRFVRRTPTIEGVVATLYLKGVSSNDFDSVLSAIYGTDAGRLSASTVGRLKEGWHQEYEHGRKRELSSTQYAYLWADGVYCNARIEGERSGILVVGAKYNREKELLAVTPGYRESEASWKELLLELKDRGMSIDPKLAIADGALGFWNALPQVFPTTTGRRCWVHKTANVAR